MMQIKINPPTSSPIINIVVAPPETQATFFDEWTRSFDGIDQP